MPAKQENTKPKNELITEDPNANNIQLDLDNNRIIVNKTFKEQLAKAPAIVARAEKLVNTNVNDLTEDDMSDLRKKMKPITKYQKQYDDFEKQMKRLLRERDSMLVDTFHQQLTNAGFDKIPMLTKKYHAIDHDFKANRANKRWQIIHTLFDASMSTYPELPKFAPQTLGSFNYYRVHHPKLISQAKTKPVTKATKAQFNQDIYQYHQDMSRLLNSTLSAAYYSRVIEQYADEPTTTNMLSLIDNAIAQQVKDQNTKLLAQVSPEAQKLLGPNWFQNDKINNVLDSLNKGSHIDPKQFQITKLKLMRQESDAIIASLDPNQFVKDGKIDTDKLEVTLRPQLNNAAKRIYKTIYEALNHQRSADQKPNQTQSRNGSQALKQTLKPKAEPYSWLIDYLQDTKHANIHENNKAKVEVLSDLFNNLVNKDAIWRSHLHSYDDIIKLTEYIINL